MGPMIETPATLEAANGPVPAESETTSVSVADKWQGAVTQGSGFVAVPMALLRLQSKYGLSPTEMLVLINLLAHWWDPTRTVFPRTTTIADRMGVDKRTIQRATNKLIRTGLLSRQIMPDGKRSFGFDPLAKRLARDMTVAYGIQRQETHEG